MLCWRRKHLRGAGPKARWSMWDRRRHWAGDPVGATVPQCHLSLVPHIHFPITFVGWMEQSLIVHDIPTMLYLFLIRIFLFATQQKYWISVRSTLNCFVVKKHSPIDLIVCGTYDIVWKLLCESYARK